MLSHPLWELSQGGKSVWLYLFGRLLSLHFLKYSSFSQANLSFDKGESFIDQHPIPQLLLESRKMVELSRICYRTASDSRNPWWTIANEKLMGNCFIKLVNLSWQLFWLILGGVNQYRHNNKSLAVLPSFYFKEEIR